MKLKALQRAARRVVFGPARSRLCDGSISVPITICHSAQSIGPQTAQIASTQQPETNGGRKESGPMQVGAGRRRVGGSRDAGAIWPVWDPTVVRPERDNEPRGAARWPAGPTRGRPLGVRMPHTTPTHLACCSAEIRDDGGQRERGANRVTDDSLGSYRGIKGPCHDRLKGSATRECHGRTPTESGSN